MLDYKDIITKHYALGMSGKAIAESLKVSVSGVNDFLRAFRNSPVLSYPLPEGITNYGIAALVYGEKQLAGGRDPSYEQPDYETVAKEMSSRKNMTLVVLWNRYSKQCRDRGVKFYSYRQFCENYAKWCEENKETLHFNAVIGRKKEVDFAGKTLQMVDHLTGEVMTIVVFVAVKAHVGYYFAHFPVHADVQVAFFPQLLEQFPVVSLARMHKRGQQQDFLAVVIAEDVPEYLVMGIAHHFFPCVIRICVSDAGVQKSQEIVNFGGRSHCGTGIVVRGLLFYRYNRVKPGYLVHVGAFHPAQEIAGVGRKGFNVTALSFGVQGVERQ